MCEPRNEQAITSETKNVVLIYIRLKGESSNGIQKSIQIVEGNRASKYTKQTPGKQKFFTCMYQVTQL